MNGTPNRSSTPPRMVPIGPAGRGPMNARARVEKPKSAKKTLLRLLGYLGRSRWLLILLLALMLATTATALLSPFFQAKAIDTIYVEKETGLLRVRGEELRACLITMAVIFACNALFAFVEGRVSARLSQSTVRTMRDDLFKKISRLPIRYTDTHRHGDLMSRMTNDVENVSNAISQSVTSLFSCVLTLCGTLGIMLWFSPLMSIVAIVFIPVSILISAKLGKFMRKYFIKQQRLLGQLNGQIEETVTSYRTVVAYGKEEDAKESFGDTSAALRDCAVSARVWGSIMGPVMNFIGNLQYVMIATVGGFLMIRGYGVTIGSIQAMLQYSKKLTHPINMIANQYSSILTALAGAERIFETMDHPNEIDEGGTSLSPDRVRGEIEFEDVHFGYVEDEPVLRGFALSVKAGQKIAIVGATGSGKTTVVNLLTRFYETDAGRITIDGVDIREIPKAELRRLIAIVLQDTVLFSDTIRNNIKYGRPEASDEAMRAAATTAKAHRFIERLPQGYDTVLSEGGSNLSQGQRQLLAIARAVLADPKILILDEATSNVDTRTEVQIQEAMMALMKNRTSLVIAHRLSTIRDADTIVVVKDGRIAEAGNHDELLARDGEYAKLYYSQFAGIAI